MNAIVNMPTFEANHVSGPNQAQPRAMRGAGVCTKAIWGTTNNHEIHQLSGVTP